MKDSKNKGQPEPGQTSCPLSASEQKPCVANAQWPAIDGIASAASAAKSCQISSDGGSAQWAFQIQALGIRGASVSRDVCFPRWFNSDTLQHRATNTPPRNTPRQPSGTHVTCRLELAHAHVQKLSPLFKQVALRIALLASGLLSRGSHPTLCMARRLPSTCRGNRTSALTSCESQSTRSKGIVPM